MPFTSTLLSNYLANLRIELYMAHYNTVSSEWRDLDYTPDYSKFYYIDDGEGWLKIGDEDYHPKSGQLILMPEGVKQSYSTISEHVYTKWWCHFNAFVGDLNVFQLVKLPLVWDVPDRTYVESIMQAVVTHANTGSIYGMLLAKSKLMELIAYCVSQTDTERVELQNIRAIEKLSDVLEYIHQDIERGFTVQELAEVAHVHPNYFIRLFKRHLGVPPIQYITQKKMEKAKQLLITTGSSVSEIAERVGFSDLFYFSKQFKKMTGLTPSEYRKQGTMGYNR